MLTYYNLNKFGILSIKRYLLRTNYIITIWKSFGLYLGRIFDCFWMFHGFFWTRIFLSFCNHLHICKSCRFNFNNFVLLRSHFQNTRMVAYSRVNCYSFFFIYRNIYCLPNESYRSCIYSRFRFFCDWVFNLSDIFQFQVERHYLHSFHDARLYSRLHIRVLLLLRKYDLRYFCLGSLHVSKRNHGVFLRISKRMGHFSCPMGTRTCYG